MKKNNILYNFNKKPEDNNIILNMHQSGIYFSIHDFFENVDISEFKSEMEVNMIDFLGDTKEINYDRVLMSFNSFETKIKLYEVEANKMIRDSSDGEFEINLKDTNYNRQYYFALLKYANASDKDIKIKLSEDCGLYKSILRDVNKSMDKKITSEQKVFQKKQYNSSIIIGGLFTCIIASMCFLAFASIAAVISGGVAAAILFTIFYHTGSENMPFSKAQNNQLSKINNSEINLSIPKDYEQAIGVKPSNNRKMKIPENKPDNPNAPILKTKP